MMGNYGGMMEGVGIWWSIYSIVILVDLILLGIWLWQQIQHK